MKSLLKLAFAAAMAVVAPAAMADDIVVNHAQGETTVSGVPAKVLTSDWAAVDNLNALGIAVAGAPASNAPGYLDGVVPADAIQIGSLFEPDFEGIAASEADLYIVGGRSAKAYETGKEILPTIDLTVSNADIIAGLKSNLATLGEVFGKQDKAAELTAALDAKVAEVKTAAEGKGNALILVTNAGKVGVYGPDSRVSWLHNQIGIPSAMANVKDGDHGGDGVSFEFILETNPDWLFVIDRDAGTGDNTGAAAALLDNELVNQTTAVKEGHIVYLDPQASYITMNGYGAVMLLLDQVLAGLTKA